MSSVVHIPVLPQEVLETLQPEAGKLYVDATVGGGGHAKAILQKIPQAGAALSLIGIDQDTQALQRATEVLAPFAPQFQLIQGNFANITQLLVAQGIDQVTGGILADIGVSSFQLGDGERGFSFLKPGPLDMRMDPTQPLTAERIVNEWPEGELIRIFSEYGEERFSKTIAREIVQQRKQARLTDTETLAHLVAGIHQRILKGSAGKSKIHPATQVFQALRIAVNDELGSLSRFLEQLPALLAPGARVAVISFHSLEDRIVKRFFQQEAQGCICPPRFPVCQCGHQPTLKVLTPRPVTATEQEVKENPRARSAKLRAATRL